ncbi:hypothetical protein EON65_26580 [archaeon]|nr:MAG: hypothetical protein EON65_26580 [archaeon]
MATQRSSPFKPISTKHKEVYKNAGRPIMSRQDRHSIGLVASLMPSQVTPGCLMCCSAPACCPLCAVCPCCGDAEYIAAKRKASTYIFIRENSIEWNDPKIVMQTGVCCGVDPCMYDVQDHVQVGCLNIHRVS